MVPCLPSGSFPIQPPWDNLETNKTAISVKERRIKNESKEQDGAHLEELSVNVFFKEVCRPEFASTCLGCLLVSLGHEESCLETPRLKHSLPAQGLLKEPWQLCPELPPLLLLLEAAQKNKRKRRLYLERV